MSAPATTVTTPPNVPFSLGTLEQALVGGTGALSVAALAGEFGPLSSVFKAICVLTLAVDSLLGYKHVTA